MNSWRKHWPFSCWGSPGGVRKEAKGWSEHHAERDRSTPHSCHLRGGTWTSSAVVHTASTRLCFSEWVSDSCNGHIAVSQYIYFLKGSSSLEYFFLLLSPCFKFAYCIHPLFIRQWNGSETVKQRFACFFPLIWAVSHCNGFKCSCFLF